MDQQITYKTENSIFEFAKPDVFERLNFHKKELNSLEADMIEKYLSCGGGGCHHNVVPEEYDYFNIIAIQLIEKEKGGEVTCKVCDKTYQASELKSIKVGFGRTPIDEDERRDTDRLRLRAIFGKEWFRVAIDNIKNPFRKRKSNPPMFGGKGYACPNDHELITLVTWRT